MDRAYDSILQTIVFASDADPADRFRYTCLCCKEYVFVASPEQKVQVAHFRHRPGNNGTADCENYMPQPGQSTGGLKPQSGGIIFYYDHAKKGFFISLTLSEEEIQQCEQAGVLFELRVSRASAPFYSCAIDSLHFAADSAMPFQISQYSEKYYCSFSADGQKRTLHVFEKGHPTFFKVLGNAGIDFTAKQVQSKCLYTGTTYLAVFSPPATSIAFPTSVNVMERISFRTFNKDFVGVLLQFKSKDADIDYYLSQMGYHLEAAESLSVVWPPMPQVNDAYVSDSESIFIASSFQLRSKGNTNAEEQEIMPIEGDISCIVRSSEIRIHYKNIDTTVKFAANRQLESRPLIVEEESKDRFIAPDNQGIYVLHQDGTHLLRTGQVATLLADNFVGLYWHTYILKRIHGRPVSTLHGKDLIDDILRNYKVCVPYDATQFDGLKLSQVASEYLLECKEIGTINRAVAELIRRGVI